MPPRLLKDTINNEEINNNKVDSPVINMAYLHFDLANERDLCLTKKVKNQSRVVEFCKPS